MEKSDYDQLAKEVEQLRREQDRITGARDALKKKLLKDFGKKNTKAARVLLQQLIQQEKEKENEIRNALEGFQRRLDKRSQTNGG